MPGAGDLFLGEEMHTECIGELVEAIGEADGLTPLGEIMRSLFLDRSLA